MAGQDCVCCGVFMSAARAQILARSLTPLGLHAASAAVIIFFWSWLGIPVESGNTLAPRAGPACVSYAPFRGSESPVERHLDVSAARIDEDLRLISQISHCIRTYQVDQGHQRIPALAGRYGIRVQQGLWIGRNTAENEEQITTAIKMVGAHRDAIQSLIVGNEVLLRGDQSPQALLNIIRRIKSAVSVPVTYADVWEFWLRYPEIAEAVDFITIHILPYWEDIPVAAEHAADHVGEIRRRVAARFPNRAIYIGEVGWPSHGRMRMEAEASPANQARVIQDVLALAEREHFEVNVIEAFDQPWKRAWEGTVGGYWGLFDAYSRVPKFLAGSPVSNHPYWLILGIAGILVASAVFGAAFAVRDKRSSFEAALSQWVGVAVIATTTGMTSGLTIESVLIETYDASSWFRAVAMLSLALAAPICSAASIMRKGYIATFPSVVNRSALRRGAIENSCGTVLLLVSVLAVQIALPLVFDPRYRDFPAAPLTCAVIPFVVHALFGNRCNVTPNAEMATAAVLAASAIVIVVNETFANWQAVWLSLVFLALAATLVGGDFRRIIRWNDAAGSARRSAEGRRLSSNT
jgi:glucan 1,3-beta-glucosidase